MLVITRNEEGTVQIGESIRVKVLQIDRGKVRLGITAPPEVKVLRGELVELQPPTVIPEKKTFCEPL